MSKFGTYETYLYIPQPVHHFFVDIDNVNQRILNMEFEYIDDFFEVLKDEYNKILNTLYKMIKEIKMNDESTDKLRDEIVIENIRLMMDILGRYCFNGDILTGYKWKDLFIKKNQEKFIEDEIKEVKKGGKN